VTRPDGRDDACIPQLLVLSFREGQVEHVDPSSLRIFEVDVESRSFALLGNSAVDVEGGELFGWVDHPGVYGVIGLPQSPAVLETLRLFQRFRPQLKEEADRGERRVAGLAVGCVVRTNPGGRALGVDNALPARVPGGGVSSQRGEEARLTSLDTVDWADGRD
jgi:hypothetical protein